VCFFFFDFIAAVLKVERDFSTNDTHQKDRKEEKINTIDFTFFFDVF